MTSIHHTLRAAALAAAALFIGFGAQAQVSENFNSLEGKTSAAAANTTPYGGTNVLPTGSNPLIDWSWSATGAVAVGGNDYNNSGPIVGDNFIILSRGESFTFGFSLSAPISNVEISFLYSNTNGNPDLRNQAGNLVPVGTAGNSWTMDSLSGPLNNGVVPGTGNPGSPGSQSFTQLFTNLAAGNHTFTWARENVINSGSLRIDDFSATVTAVPEPETYAMMLAGLGAVGFLSRRRKAQQA